MKNLYPILFLLLLTTCGLRYETKGEIVSPELQKNAFWNKSGPCDLDSLLKLSKEQNKPVLLYFTGYGCVNNRKMEDRVFVDKDIYDLMHEKFIPFALYVDDMKTKLDSVFTTEEGVEIKTVGKYHHHIQQSMFKKMSQPHIAIIRSDKSIVSETTYTPSKVDFKDFLTKALADF